MSFFEDFARSICCCVGRASDDAAPILDSESGRPSEVQAPSRYVADQPPQLREPPQASEPSVTEQLAKMQHDIDRLKCQIERLRIFMKENAQDIFRLEDIITRESRVTYSPNYVTEEQEIIPEVVIGEVLHENENAIVPVQDFSNRLTTIASLNDDENYNMKHKNRGKLIIFAHTWYEKKLPPRPNAIEEANRVKKTFEKVGFEVKIYQDCTVKDIERILLSLSKEDYTDDDCICIYVSTHGKNGYLEANDDKYPVRIFEKCLCSIRTLDGKPKIIFIQACRGKKVNKGIADMTSVNEEDKEDEADYSINCNSIPFRADTFIIYSTSPGFLSWRAWMMPTFCDMMDKYGDEDFVTILTKTNNQISKFESYSKNPKRNKGRQICCFDISPRKKIYFR